MLVCVVTPWGLGENGIMSSESSFRLRVPGLGLHPMFCLLLLEKSQRSLLSVPRSPGDFGTSDAFSLDL